MMLFFLPSLVVTRTTGPGSIIVKALSSFNGRMDVTAEYYRGALTPAFRGPPGQAPSGNRSMRLHALLAKLTE